MLSFVKRRWKVVLPVAVALTALGAWLAFGYFGVQYLFIDDEVVEAEPVFDRATTPTTARGPADTGGAPTTAPPASVPEILTLATGSFVDRSHPTSGAVVVLTDGSEQRFLRFEGLETDNGPDLNVYLSAAPFDADASAFDDDFVDLGDLKGNIGDQNYEIPPGVDLDRYGTVVIWCVRFSVAFGTADLVPQAA